MPQINSRLSRRLHKPAPWRARQQPAATTSLELPAAGPEPFPAAQLPRLIVSAQAQARVRWSLEHTANECTWWGELESSDRGLHLATVHLARHQASYSYTVPDMDHYADLVADLHAARGLEPWQLACWLHTHPAGCNRPSGTDEQTFAEHFGRHRLALMLIVTHDHEWYGELGACQAPWEGLADIRGTSPLAIEFEDAERRVDADTARRLAESYAELVTALPPRLPSLVHPAELYDPRGEELGGDVGLWFEDEPDPWRELSTLQLTGFRMPTDRECLRYLEACGWGLATAREADVLDLEMIAGHFGDDAMLIAEARAIRDRLAILLASAACFEA